MLRIIALIIFYCQHLSRPKPTEVTIWISPALRTSPVKRRSTNPDCQRRSKNRPFGGVKEGQLATG